MWEGAAPMSPMERVFDEFSITSQRGRRKKGRGKGEGEKRKRGGKGGERLLLEPVFLYSTHHFLN